MLRLKKINKINEPLVTIVIPVYNGSNYLAEAIDSALAQTYKNIEIIVVNDGSRDNGATEEIAKSYGNKIRYFKKENGGVATALNLGIEKMSGDYFSWLSHDDLYYPKKIEKQMIKFLSTKNENLIVACNSSQILENGLSRKLKINARAFRYTDIFLGTSSKIGLNGCSLLIPVRIIKEYGGFDEKLKYTQDYDLWYKLAKKNTFFLIEDSLVKQRIHQNQDSILKKYDLDSAADKMHSDFLHAISQKRFNLFFMDNKNLKFYISNYHNYKKRNYPKTSIAMLRPLLVFLKSHNQPLWHKVLVKERSYIEALVSGGNAANDLKVKSFKKHNTDISKISKVHKAILEFNIDKIYFNYNSIEEVGYISNIFYKIINLTRDTGFLLSCRLLVKKFSKKLKRFI